jgi:hypothetical protein
MFVSDTVDLGIEFKLPEFKLGKEIENLRCCFVLEDEALKKINKSLLTVKINVADSDRDVDFRYLVDSIKTMTKHYDPETADAAQHLKIVADTYGNLARKPLNEETSGIINFLQELRGKYAVYVAKLKLTDIVDRLEASNNVVKQLSKERGDETAEKTELKLKECRLESDRAYAELIDMLRALMKVDGEENYRDFVVRLNVNIDKYNNIVAQRKGKAKAAKDKKKEV